jgi:integrase
VRSIAPRPIFIKTIESTERIAVNIDSMIVRSDDGQKRDFALRRAMSAASDELKEAAFAVLLHALNGRKKTSVCIRWRDELSLFLRTVQAENGNRSIRTITLGMHSWYAAQKGASQVKLLRGVLLFWISLEIPGLAEDLVTFLPSSRPPKPRSMIEVQNSSPRERPLSMKESHELLTAVGRLYVSGQFDDQDNLLWRLMISEAMRPSQLALLRMKDVRITHSDTGVASASVSVPMVKQKGTAARDFTMDHDLSSALSYVLDQHVKFVERVLGHVPDGDLPLFCLLRPPPTQRGYTVKATPISMASYITTTGRMLSRAYSSEESIELFNRRLKHTKLTHLAQAGATIEVLAAAGFQTSTVSLVRYVNLTDEAFEIVEAKMAPTHEFIHDAFRGVVVSRDEATHPDLEHAISDADVDGDLGSCGIDLCGMVVCLGCYTCDHFEAFPDGPHEAVEQRLVKRQQRESLAGTNAADNRTAKTLAGVRHVIWLIAQKPAGKS